MAVRRSNGPWIARPLTPTIPTRSAKKIAVASSGKITVKKGLKAGKTYTVKVKATSKATANYKAASKVVKLKVKVTK